ncbi:MAG: hypothetical protein KKG10_02535, partial [Proteobacteria bacterium]|nr:hypothetical protein [Pseudomonadota bacterium]
FRMPDADRYFLLDREYHLFDIGYLHSRFESSTISEILAARPNKRAPRTGNEERQIQPTTVSEQEDMYEALADA